DSKSQKRVARVARGSKARLAPTEGGEVDNNEKRRKQVQETLKDLEEKQKEQKKKISLRTKMERAGLEIEPRTFYIASVIAGLVAMLLLKLSGLSVVVAVLGGFVAAFGLPRWVLSYLVKRRQNAFAEEFANSI